MFFTRKVESPLRYSKHLPAGITANSLDEAAKKLEREAGVSGVAGRAICKVASASLVRVSCASPLPSM